MFQKIPIFFLIISTYLIITDSSSNGRYRLRPGLITSRMSEIDTTNACHYGICEDIDDYPNDLIDQLAEKHSDLKSYFGKVIEPHKSMLNLRGGFGDLMNLCETRTYTVKPKFIKDIYGNYRFVVNTDENQQLIVYETCANKLHKCFDGPINTEAFCEQKFSVIKLVALDNNQTLSHHRFRIPQTCVCAYQKNCLIEDC